MLFGRLKKKRSGQALKPMTARQVWTLTNFKFLEAHLTICTDTRHLGTVVVPAEVEEEENAGDDDDAPSLASARSSSQVPSGMQPAQHVSGRPQSSP